MSDLEFITNLVERIDQLHDAGMDFISATECADEFPDDAVRTRIRREAHRQVIDRLREVEPFLGMRLLELVRRACCPNPDRFGAILHSELNPLYGHRTVRKGMIRVQDLMIELCTVRKFVTATVSPSSTEVAQPPASVSSPQKKTSRIPADEANQIVMEYLKRNAKENPGVIRIRTVAQETGISQGGVAKTASWKVFQEWLKSRRKPQRASRQLSDAMRTTIPDWAADDPAEIAAEEGIDQIIQEQQQDLKSERRSRRYRS